MNTYDFSIVPWKKFSKKLTQKILHPRCAGSFHEQKEKERLMRVVVGEMKDNGEYLRISLLVDESDGVIADAKFQLFGPSVLIGIAEGTCELLLRKNYEQAKRVSADLIDKHLRDVAHIPAFPEESGTYLNKILSSIDEALSACADIPLKKELIESPLPSQVEGDDLLVEFENAPKVQKIALIEKIIEEEIRPYIELDAGGIEIIDLKGYELSLRYKGACTTCPSSTGATLDAIQNILQMKLSSQLIIKPDFSS